MFTSWVLQPSHKFDGGHRQYSGHPCVGCLEVSGDALGLFALLGFLFSVFFFLERQQR